MDKSRLDYIIIGNGLAGLQLALAMANDPFFDTKEIALIDSSKKLENDKTWCFWEKGHGLWNDIISKTWNSCNFHSSKQSYDINLDDYQYKLIQSLDFYNYAKDILNNKNNFSFIIDTVKSIDGFIVNGQNTSYKTNYIFDSRIPEDYFSGKDNYTRVFQHFKGWIIETETDTFNPESFTVMDYRIKHNNDTTFTYVLPLTKRKALVEFTFFTSYTVEDQLYDTYLKSYITNILNIEDYAITESEQGVIPMTDFKFKNYNTEHITKIGTGGGWVKGSTGYSFKHTEKKVSKIIDNIKQNKLPHFNLYNKKFAFYDKIFLKVLHDENPKGEWIFEQFYTKNNTKTMFRFLDEESHFSEDLKIMLSLFSSSFIKAFFKTL
ncbi:lycopene cyclase family protein [Ichthyenterobacterium sp. W332]|uniref:Lycopene cyclase family protein n=1 Tax=Microcosmobacter mediterraneus TaxID=3075607 RepID=A0ABU2YQU4_9FLAO|nr:lycopene cyclase family protein [Ichthyenterobacterium sp. W332]MDT0559453.1 lycopene cyclase family protein [Ichthyenterobacterium sp. W332]